MPTDSAIYHKSVHSGKWLVITALVGKAINIGTFFVLARLLVPSDYGVIGIIFIVNQFLDSVSSPGLGAAVLQKQGDIEPYLDTLWTFDLLRYGFLALVIYCTSPLIAGFFKISASQIILIKLGGCLPVIAALGNIRQLFFFRELEYKKVFFRELAGQLAYTITAISYVWLVTPSVWALFLAYVSRYMVTMFFSYILYPSLPRFAWHFSRLRSLLRYGKWIYGQGIIDFVLGSVDKVVVGGLLNPTQLGIYSRAKDIPSIILGPVADLFGKIGFSAYVKVQGQLAKIQIGFMRGLDVLLLIMLPFSLLMLFEGGSIVSVVLGAKWLEIVVPLKILSVANIFLGLHVMLVPLFNAVGRPDITFKVNIVQLIISPLVFYIAIKYFQLRGAAVATAIIWLLLVFWGIYYARPLLRLGWEHFRPTVITFGAASLATALLAAVGHGILHRYLTNFQILGWVIFLGLFYLGVVWVVGKQFAKGPVVTMQSIWHQLVSRSVVIQSGEPLVKTES